jgi:hypothetical protein
LGGRDRRIVISRPAITKLVRPYLRNKIQNQKELGGIAQEVKSLSAIYEALHSIPRAAKINK